MINDLDETLKQLLIKNVPLDPAEVDISFEMPDREWSASISKPTVNLYLYNIQENHELRDNEWSVAHNNGVAVRRKPPVRVDLSYLITVWTSDMADQHRLLGHILSTLFRYPKLPEDMRKGSLIELDWDIRTFTAQPDGILRNSADFWSALDNQLKPSINYVVTLPVDLDMAISAPEVKSKVFKFKGGNGASPEDIVQISGIVCRKGKPAQVIPDARVLVKELQMSTNTNAEGKYAFNKLNFGSYNFEVSVKGEKERQVPIVVPSASYDIEL